MKNLPILSTDEDLTSAIEAGCRFSSRWANTLGGILSPSLYQSKVSGGTWLHTTGYVCDVSTYCFCQKRMKKSVVKSYSTGKELTIRDYMNCGTNNVVYSVECTSCNLQYVGCTARPLRTWIGEHYQGAYYPSDKGLSNVSKHFKHLHAGNMSDFSFYGLQKVKKTTWGGWGWRSTPQAS